MQKSTKSAFFEKLELALFLRTLGGQMSVTSYQMTQIGSLFEKKLSEEEKLN